MTAPAEPTDIWAPPTTTAAAPSKPWATPMRFRRVSGLATATLVSAATLTSADCALVAASLGGPGALLDAAAALHTFVLLVAWIAASLWLFMVRRNAATLVPDGVSAAPWAVLGWVVPIAWFWIPKGLVDDSWEDTARGCRDGSTAGSTNGWWALWITYGIVGTIATRCYQQGVTGGAMSILLLLPAVVSVAALAAWVKVVRGVTATQDRLVAARNS